MESKCIQCNVELVERKNYKFMVAVGNPVQIPMVGTFEECPSCGQRLFNEQEGIRVAEFIDKSLRDGREVKAPVGTKVIIVDR